MIECKSFVLINAGFIPGYTYQKLYIIKYGDHTMYVGKSGGRDKDHNSLCRVATHFGVSVDDCLYENNRSGASRQFNNMLDMLPKDVQNQFTIIMLNPHEISHFCNLDNPELRLKMISNGITREEVDRKNCRYHVIKFCETALAWSLCPVYDKSENSRCSNGLPDELVKYLIQNN